VAVLPVLQSVVWNLMPATTVGRAVNAATQRLEEAGVSTARLDAQVILAHVLGVGRSWLFAHFEYALDDAQANQFTELIARRVKHEPVAYLIGRKEFYGIELQVDRRVLIPRPETEMLVDAVLVLAANQSPEPLTVADVGTGSGAIALAVAANAENARIFALDVSKDALAVAAGNMAHLDSGSQVTLLHSDLLEALPEPVDVVVANLPYVTSADYHTLDADVRKFEPQLALEAGKQGLDVIARLLRQVPAHLCPGGSVILEIGYNQGKAALDLVTKILPQALQADVHKDYQGRDRMVTFSLS
jgi:release factor glutamine methyltransferase